MILDQEGKRWNVDATVPRSDVRRPEIVLERWRIELDPRIVGNDEPPIIYKKSIVLFRSLYAYVRLLPAWRLRRKMSKSKISPTALKLSCRILNGAYPISSRGRIGLSIPVLPGEDQHHFQNHKLHRIETSGGAFVVGVSYRTNCEFRVDESESLLSSHFLNLDQHDYITQHHQPYVSASASSAVSVRRHSRSSKSPGPISSLPSRTTDGNSLVEAGVSYSSLTSFYPNQPATATVATAGTPIPGTSQLSAHRHQQSLSSSASSARNIGISGSHSSINSIVRYSSFHRNLPFTNTW